MRITIDGAQGEGKSTIADKMATIVREVWPERDVIVFDDGESPITKRSRAGQVQIVVRQRSR